MDRDDLKQFTDALSQGASISAPKASTSALQGYFDQAFQNSFSDVVGGAAGNAVSEVARQQNEREEESRQRQVSRLKRRLDPSNYRKVRKDDGGFAFYDPEGNQIDISTYAQMTGKRRADVLADSENPIDLQFIADYTNMQDVMDAFYNDKQKFNQYVEQNEKLRNVTPQNAMQQLVEYYPHMFGNGSYDQTLQNMNRLKYPAVQETDSADLLMQQIANQTLGSGGY